MDSKTTTALSLTGLFLIGCTRPDSALVGSAAGPDRLAVSILCDPRSSCTSVTLGQAYDAALPSVAEIPNSTTDLWLLGNGPVSTTIVASASSPAPGRRGRKADERGRAAFIAESKTSALAAFQQHAAEYADTRQTPVAEAITRIALHGKGIRARHVVVSISSLRQRFGSIDLTAGPLPDEGAFLSALHRSGVLTPGSLRGVSLALSFFDLAPASSGRRPTSLQRHQATEQLVGKALLVAGADAVRVSSGPIDIKALLNGGRSDD
jgi:hypothetical protein